MFAQVLRPNCLLSLGAISGGGKKNQGVLGVLAAKVAGGPLHPPELASIQVRCSAKHASQVANCVPGRRAIMPGLSSEGPSFSTMMSGQQPHKTIIFALRALSAQDAFRFGLCSTQIIFQIASRVSGRCTFTDRPESHLPVIPPQASRAGSAQENNQLCSALVLCAHELLCPTPTQCGLVCPGFHTGNNAIPSHHWLHFHPSTARHHTH